MAFWTETFSREFWQVFQAEIFWQVTNLPKFHAKIAWNLGLKFLNGIPCQNFGTVPKLSAQNSITASGIEPQCHNKAIIAYLPQISVQPESVIDIFWIPFLMPKLGNCPYLCHSWLSFPVWFCVAGHRCHRSCCCRGGSLALLTIITFRPCQWEKSFYFHFLSLLPTVMSIISLSKGTLWRWQ